MASQPCRWSVVIPAFNEERRLPPYLEGIAAYFDGHGESYEVLVVDDGSTDGTSERVRELARAHPEIQVERFDENHGKGYAVRSGIVNARGRLVLFQDADGATPIDQLEVLEKALADGADVAIGSRNVEADGVRVTARFYRRVMGRAFHALVGALTVRGIADTQCGFKLFRSEVAHDLFSRMRMRGFSFDVEVLLMAQRRGYRILEKAVNWTHQPGSRVNLVVDSLKMAGDLFVIRSHAMRGHYDQPHVAQLYSTPASSIETVAH